MLKTSVVHFCTAGHIVPASGASPPPMGGRDSPRLIPQERAPATMTTFSSSANYYEGDRESPRYEVEKEINLRARILESK